MTRMTGPDCAVMCNLINTHTHTHINPHSIQADETIPTQKEGTVHTTRQVGTWMRNTGTWKRNTGTGRTPSPKQKIIEIRTDRSSTRRERERRITTILFYYLSLIIQSLASLSFVALFNFSRLMASPSMLDTTHRGSCTEPRE